MTSQDTVTSQSVHEQSEQPQQREQRGQSEQSEQSEQGGQLPGYAHDKPPHIARLRRIEGQVRGLQRLVESDTYCIDVLTQVSAAKRALDSFALALLEEHLGHCVAHAIGEGGVEADDKISEASAAIARLVRS